MAVRVCSKCKNEKDLLLFNKDKKGKAGYRSFCKFCESVSRKARSKITQVTVKEKLCIECGLVKAATDFYICRRALDGLQKYCKRCHLAISKINYELDPESHKKRMRESAKTNKSKRKLYAAEYYKREIYKNKSELRKQKSKQTYRVNKPRYREYGRRKRALIAKVTLHKFSMKEFDQRMSVFGHQCAYCGGPFEHLDHVIPLSRGGYHCLSNFRPACRSCNLSKHAKSLKEWQTKT